MNHLHRHYAGTPTANPGSTPDGGSVEVESRPKPAPFRVGETFGVVGSGPMATYALKQLLKGSAPIRVTVFETDRDAGCGMPYRAGMNADFMYCNAFSREIPPITQGFAHWLGSREDSFLARWDLTRDDVGVREFYPRVLLGKFLKDEFRALCENGRHSGHAIEVLTGHRVTDIVPGRDRGATCVVRTPSGAREHRFDRVLIATGHVWPETPRIDGATLVSPWPYTNVTELKPGRIGILGSSLSAIDAVVALGHAHGEFDEDGANVLWTPKAGAEGMSITMVSHKGIMPEPDFFYPHPYEPLKHVTRDAVAAEVAKGPEGLLERVFDLLLAELEEADADHLTDLGSGARTIGGFSDAYFERRERLGGLQALRRTLDEAERSLKEKETIADRYALLRGHESFDLALAHLNDADWRTFSEKLMPVFGDCYAAIPHVSVHRVLALHEAGVLDILPTGAESTFADSNAGVAVRTVDGDVTFDALVDARGQAAAPLSELPFPSLVKMLEVPDRPLLERFGLNLTSGDRGSVICLAMPQLLERHPFSQGLPNCHELARTAMKAVTG